MPSAGMPGSITCEQIGRKGVKYCIVENERIRGSKSTKGFGIEVGMDRYVGRK